MFIDRVVVEVRSGKGGDGAIAFLHEKYIAKGGPSGGNGGRGGSIILKASSKVTTLINYRFSKVIKAEDGENGATKNKYGRSAKDVYCEVPVGTVIIDEKTNKVLFDLKHDGDEFIVAKGGRGGRGNACFKSSRNKAPKVAENGVPGETKRLVLELKLLADAGLVGLPNAGKSTFLSIVTKANPVIADYPFTTISPNLGVCNLKDGRSFVLADLPGLIEGASEGKGLGFTFLRHIERCKVLIHFVSMESEDPYDDYLLIKKELEKYGHSLLNKKYLIVATKVEDDESSKKFEEFKTKINEEVIPLSSLIDFNIDQVLYKAMDAIEKANEELVNEETDDNSGYKIYDAHEEEKDIFKIRKIKSDTYQIYGQSIERTYALINISTDEGLMKLISYLKKVGVEEELKRMGAKDGDTVLLCDFEFEYFE